MLQICVTHEESEHILNDFHSRACGGHLFGSTPFQTILHARYFWPMTFKDCMIVVIKCHLCQILTNKMRTHLDPLHPVVPIDPFAKWGINFTLCNPTSVSGHHYIIVVVDYFKKWAEAMPTFSNDA